jgi:transposase
MSRSKHTEAQIIAALKQVEAGRTTDDVARECGVSKHTIYGWKAGAEPKRSPETASGSVQSAGAPVSSSL